LQNQQNSRRKAQKLAEKGATDEALAEYGRLAREGHLEPYDLVVYGDLLSRTGNRSEAVSRYLEAMDSYSKAGLNRNAIALGKKIRRLAPHETNVHRKLGELYTAEGLASESCLHYLEFLEHVDVKADGVAEAIEDVCGKLLTLSLPSFQVVPKIVQAAKTVGREKKLGEGVLHQMRRAVATGNREAEQTLHGLLTSLDPALAAGAGREPEPADPAAIREASPFELDATSLTARARQHEPPAARQSVDTPALSLRDFSFDEPETEPQNGASGGEHGHDPNDSDAFESAEALREQGQSSFERKDTVRAQRFFMKAAYRFFEAGQSPEAAELYERVVKIDPNHLDALRGLVEIAHINGERAKMAHWGSELGDVLLAREMFAEAKVQFQRVLAFDPQNPKATQRLRRLNTIAEVKDVGYGGLAPSTREVEGAQVVVRDDEKSQSSQSTLNLSQILDEFRAAVVHRIPENDAQSHYDLGMTYKEMGLLEEAVREFEIASQNEGNRPASLDIMGECYLLLSQFDQAAEVLENVLAETGGNAPVHMRLGKAYEALGDWDRAEEEYHRALELDENLEEALELLQNLEFRRTQGAA
jgi:tetratricopeptide (TPR) repeat protein